MSSKTKQIVESAGAVNEPSPALFNAMKTIARPGIVHELVKSGHATEDLQNKSTTDLAKLLLAAG